MVIPLPRLPDMNKKRWTMQSEDGSLSKNLCRLAIFKVNSCTLWFGHTALLTVLSNYSAEPGQRVCRQVWRGLSISLSSLASELSRAWTSKPPEELKGPLARLSLPSPPLSREVIPRAPDVREESCYRQLTPGSFNQKTPPPLWT